MKKKIFTLLLLAVFMLAQFSIASAATIADVTATITPLPTFSWDEDIPTIEYSLSGMPGAATQEVFIWWKDQTQDWNAARCINPTGNVDNLTAADGSYTFVGNYVSMGYGDNDMVEFLVTVVDGGNCATAANLPAADEASLANTFLDSWFIEQVMGTPPSLEYNNVNNHVSCNTFENWALGSDSIHNFHEYGHQAGYSGFKAWNQSATGTFAPAPEGPDAVFLAWGYTFPSTASGVWSFSIDPEDMVGQSSGPYYFRDGVTIDADELEDCADFTDTAGHADELYVRYLADLGLIAGNPDGSFSPDNTLTRAEASALFEKANGYDDTMLPVAAPSAECTFTDVSSSDWFAGWVWQACADGFMNGIGGGLFDPSNLLTRGQIVTIFNNIHEMDNGVDGSYLESTSGPNSYSTFLNNALSSWDPFPLRTAAWTDVAIGAYYAIPVVRAYGVGVVDGTSDTTFSPDQAVLRGEFAKMLYRVLSIYN